MGPRIDFADGLRELAGGHYHIEPQIVRIAAGRKGAHIYVHTRTVFRRVGQSAARSYSLPNSQIHIAGEFA